MFSRSASRDGQSIGDRSVASAATSSRRRSLSLSNCRIYGPRDLKDEFLLGDLKKESKPVLSKIAKFYRRMKNQKLGYSGFCLGLLDPTSNILANFSMLPVKAAWEADGEEIDADVIQRSFDGLHAFLTCLFPYLADVEAVRYLEAAEADPLVASLLIINRRGIEQSFRLDSDTTAAAVEVALRCAAVAARHPDPHKLVLGWKVLSPDLKELLPSLQVSSNRDAVMIRKAKMEEASGTSGLVLQLKEAWDLAKSRLHRAKPQGLPLARAARKRVLIAIIHRFYLTALAKLPKDELCSRYHHSLLKAGHCYGPMDPVSNIIINTVWYDRAYPPSKQVKINMISTRCLMRIVARSFYGLVSFMCTRYPDRTADQVLERLLVANADLRVADPTLRRKDFGKGDLTLGSFRAMASELTKRSGGSSTLTDIQLAFAAAAFAASHPVPHEQQVLLGSPDMFSTKLLLAQDMLHKDGRLSTNDVGFLASLFMSPIANEPCQPQPEPQIVDKPAYMEFSYRCQKFWSQHDSVERIVGVALAKFNRNKVHKYRLHLICGANQLVSGPEYNITLSYDKRNPLIYYHTHVNFLVTCEDPQFAHGPAMLFFAECDNYNTKESWCVPVMKEQNTEHVRCIYCERQGTTIVHPAVRTFHGRDREFDNVLRGERLFTGSDIINYNNYSLLVGSAPDSLDDFLADDFIYCDYVPDPNAREIGFPFLFMTEK